MIDRKTGHRLRRQFVDSETGKPVDADDQVKGYETAKNEYVMIEPEEIAAAIPESDKTLAIEAFIACDEVDDLYFERPYYLAPSGAAAEQAFAVLREGMRRSNVAAIATAMLFRRMHTLLLRPDEKGMLAILLSFDYEVRSSKEAFDEIPEIKLEREMLDLAEHIIKTKKGVFDPKDFDDRYEAALADVVRAKIEGRPIEVQPRAEPGKVIDLMEALRKSAAASGARPAKATKPAPKGKRTAKARPPARRKAG
jgi:DNA end-binding protein Ku